MPSKRPAHYAEMAAIVENALLRRYEAVENGVSSLVTTLRGEGEEQLARRFERIMARGGVKHLESLGPLDQESHLALLDMDRPAPDEAVIFLADDIRQEVERFVRLWAARDELFRRGLPTPNTVLLYGPPGVGKTQLARHIATRVGMPLYMARLDSVVSSYLGTTGKNLRRVFESATARPGILFLDEFDALAKARDAAEEIGEMKRTVNTLLQNVDQMPPGSILVAATNHAHLLDPAVWRRFAVRLRLGLPNLTARRAMLATWLDGWNLAEPDVTEIAEEFDGASGAEIREAIERAQTTSVVDGADLTVAAVLQEMERTGKRVAETLGEPKLGSAR